MSDDLLDFLCSLPSGNKEEKTDGAADSTEATDGDEVEQVTEEFANQPRFDEEYSGGANFDERYTSVLRALSLETFQLLKQHGYAVIDNAFGKAHASAYRQEIRWLHKNSLLSNNATAYVSNTDGKRAISQLLSKPNVLEAEMLPDVRNRLPRLSHLFKTGIPLIEEKFKRYLPELKMYHGDTSIKVQCNVGQGGCFPYHYDSPGDAKDSRRVTLLLYLNEGWVPGHGGCLRLQPFLKPAVDVPPVFDRMVLFFSHRVLHRVLPYSGPERVMLTLWFHGKSLDDEEMSLSALLSNNPSTSQSAPQGSPEYWMALLQKPSMQRLLCKPLYCSDWLRSYQQAHRDTATPLVESLTNDVKLVEEQPGLGSVVQLLKDIVKDHKPINIDGIDPATYYNPETEAAVVSSTESVPSSSSASNNEPAAQ